MLKTTHNRPKTQTFATVRGVSYRVRSIRVYTFTAYRIDGQWTEPSNAKQERNFVALQLPAVRVQATHINLTLANKGSNLIVRDVTGREYDDVTDYLGEAGMVSCVSKRDRSGVASTVHLTD